MYFLEMLYAMHVAYQKSIAPGEPRYYPFLMLFAILTAFTDSLFRTALNLFNPGTQSILAGARIYRSADWAYIIALVLALFFTWALFDRRRSQIKDRFPLLKPMGALQAMGLAAFCLCYGLFFLYLGSKSHIGSVALFIVITGSLSVYLRRSKGVFS